MGFTPCSVTHLVPPTALSIISLTLMTISYLLMRCNTRPTSKSTSSRAPTTNRAISQLRGKAEGVKVDGALQSGPCPAGSSPPTSPLTSLQTLRSAPAPALASFEQLALGLLLCAQQHRAAPALPGDVAAELPGTWTWGDYPIAPCTRGSQPSLRFF